MKRLHVHVGVEDIEQSVRFYSTLFDAEPAVRKPDYAKWMLENPRVNFAISCGHGASGVRHLGIQVEDAAELAEVYRRLKLAERPVIEEGRTTCCYAKSEKSWISDPQGLDWETFLTQGESTVYGAAAPASGGEAGDAGQRVAPTCCEPARAAEPAPARATAACGCGPDAST